MRKDLGSVTPRPAPATIVCAIAVATVAAGFAWVARAQPVGSAAPYDVLIVNGRLLDGSGNPWMRGDVAVRDGRIAAIGRLDDARAARTIDAGDRYVAPGFIDAHSHAATGLARPELSQGLPLLAQGVTTIMANPDGGGPLDLSDQRATFERQGIGPNVALLIGHNTVRAEVLGRAQRAPTAAELEEMQALVRQGMEDGAFGLSSGLFYAPGSYAATEEVIALARVAGEYGGVYTSHIRDEGNYAPGGLLASVDEVIRIAEEGDLTGVVTHMKALGPGSWGLSVAATTRIAAARRRGVSVFADQYPYEASSTSLAAALVPRWAHEGGDEAMTARIEDPADRARMLPEVAANLARRGGPDSIVVARYEPDPGLEGQSLAEIAESRESSPVDTALDLIAGGSVSIVSFNMSEADIEHIMRQPYTMTSSDGGLVAPGEGRPHPRNNGAFARKIARYVNERSTIELEFAVRSATSLPASVFGLRDRGVLRQGAWADIIVFDPAAVKDTATYTDPHRVAEGMWFVLVNGTPVVDESRFTDARPGRVLSPGP